MRRCVGYIAHSGPYFLALSQPLLLSTFFDSAAGLFSLSSLASILIAAHGTFPLILPRYGHESMLVSPKYEYHERCIAKLQFL